jgi:GTP-binding protein
MVPEEEQEERCQAVIDALNWQGPVFRIAAIAKTGTDILAQAMMNYIEEWEERMAEDPAAAAAEDDLKARLEEEARERVQQLKLARRQQRMAEKEGVDIDDDFDDDDYDVEVEYVYE